MSYFDQREDSILLMDESLLNLYDEQFEYSSFKSFTRIQKTGFIIL